MLYIFSDVTPNLLGFKTLSSYELNLLHTTLCVDEGIFPVFFFSNAVGSCHVQERACLLEPSESFSDWDENLAHRTIVRTEEFNVLTIASSRTFNHRW